MAKGKLLRTENVPLLEITHTSRLREVSEQAVSSLMQSIQDIGLQNEIILRRMKSGELRLIAGGHRVQAYKSLGLEAIPAKIYECDDHWAKLAEIDDNLAHAQLDALELSVFLAKRKSVYEKAFPSTRRGAAGAAARHGLPTDDLSVSSFAKTSAEKLGCSERQIHRLVSVGTNLDAKDISALRKAEQPVSMSDLEALAKCADPDLRSSVCTQLGQGKISKISEALRKPKQPGAKVKSDAEAQADRLKDMYSRSSKEARRRFVALFAEELREILSDPDDATNSVVFLRSNTAEGAA